MLKESSPATASLAGTAALRFDNRDGVAKNCAGPFKGVPAGALSLYEQLLREHEMSIGDADGELHLDDPSLTYLLEHAWAERAFTIPDKVYPLAPAIALSRPIDAFNEFVGAIPSHLKDVAGTLHLLNVGYAHSQRRPSRCGIDILGEQRTVQPLSGLINYSAKRDYLTWNTGPYSDPTSTEQFLVLPDEELLRDGLHTRALYARDQQIDVHGEICIRMSLEAGEDVRVIEHLPMKLMIADDHSALIPLVPLGSAALFITNATLVRVFRVFFELLWAAAAPYGSEPDHEPEEPSGVIPDIIRLMAHGEKDEAIARHLALSVRTVRRYISEVLKALGTNSRFAAGVAAYRAGWLTTQQAAPCEGARA